MISFINNNKYNNGSTEMEWIESIINIELLNIRINIELLNIRYSFTYLNMN